MTADVEMVLRAHLHSTLDHAREVSELIDKLSSAHALDTSTGMIRGAITANELEIARQLKVRRETPATVVNHPFMALGPGEWADQCNYGFPEDRCDYAADAHMKEVPSNDR